MQSALHLGCPIPQTRPVPHASLRQKPYATDAHHTVGITTVTFHAVLHQLLLIQIARSAVGASEGRPVGDIARGGRTLSVTGLRSHPPLCRQAGADPSPAAQGSTICLVRKLLVLSFTPHTGLMGHGHKRGGDCGILGLGRTLALPSWVPILKACLPGDGLGCGHHRDKLGAVGHLLLDLQARGNVRSHLCQCHLRDERSRAGQVRPWAAETETDQRKHQTHASCP